MHGTMSLKMVVICIYRRCLLKSDVFWNIKFYDEIEKCLSFKSTVSWGSVSGKQLLVLLESGLLPSSGSEHWSWTNQILKMEADCCAVTSGTANQHGNTAVNPSSQNSISIFSSSKRTGDAGTNAISTTWWGRRGGSAPIAIWRFPWTTLKRSTAGKVLEFNEVV